MLDLDVAGLKLVGSGYTSQLGNALTAASINRTLDGGSTLTLEVADYRRLLATSGVLAGKAYAAVDGLHFELVQVQKSGNKVTLTFEDAVVTELKRPRGQYKIPQSTTTRAEIAQRMCDEAGVRLQVDPAARGVYNSEFSREDQGNSWELLKTLATDIGWRCLSDGNKVLFGSDEWLASLTAPVDVVEWQDPLLSDIDFSMDVAQPASTASFSVAAERWALPPGRAVNVKGVGWGDGVWLVSSFGRKLTSATASVELVRRALVLTEPPPQKAGESGEDGYLPDDDGDISADLARLRQCESGGNYKTNTGNGFYGAYQFDVKTWRGLGYSGMPHEAPPATQDEAAKKLYQSRGWKPWPACSKKLGLVDRRTSSKVVGTATSTGNASRDRMISWALSRRGKPYAWGKGNDTDGYDCSHFVAAATKAAGVQLSAPSKDQYATCRNQGKLISVAEGLRTRGAILFRMTGSPTHVAISMGDDSTVEARGKSYGCNVFTGASKRQWTHAAIWL